MRLSILGAGYVGLISGVCLADHGNSVILTDVDRERVELINKAHPPFHEPGLEKRLRRTVSSSTLLATSDPDFAITNSDITFIVVGTPSESNGSIDLAQIRDTSRQVGVALRRKERYHLVVVRSTVIPGTTQNLVKPAIERRSNKKAGKDFGLVMQPEFLRQGSAIYDTMNPERIIIGELDSKSGLTLEHFYRHFHRKKLPPILHMNLACAEMIKYASNAFLATKISFINEIADLCEKIPGIDVVKVAQGMGLDKRIGSLFLNAGPGFGGSCFPKDLKALIAFCREYRQRPRILESVLRINDDRAIHVVDLARIRLTDLRKKRIAILGLSFKPGTDDLREAPSLRIIDRLLKENAHVVAYDPVALQNARKMLGRKIEYADSAISCLRKADAVLILTEWGEFRKLTPRIFKKFMRSPLIIDTRRIYEPAAYGSETKFTGIGLGPHQ